MLTYRVGVSRLLADYCVVTVRLYLNYRMLNNDLSIWVLMCTLRKGKCMFYDLTRVVMVCVVYKLWYCVGFYSWRRILLVGRCDRYKHCKFCDVYASDALVVLRVFECNVSGYLGVCFSFFGVYRAAYCLWSWWRRIIIRVVWLWMLVCMGHVCCVGMVHVLKLNCYSPVMEIFGFALWV
eukprot:gene2752-1737_t